MEKRKYIPVFLDWPEVTCELSWEEKGRLVDAMVLYARGDDWEACLVGSERFLFPALLGVIDRMAALSRKRAEAGRRGGMRPAGPGKANDDNMVQSRACNESDAPVNDCVSEQGRAWDEYDVPADDGTPKQDSAWDDYDAPANDGKPEQGSTCDEYDVYAVDGNPEQGSAWDESDMPVNGCFQDETDSGKAKQSEGNCAEGGYNNDNNNEYNNKYNNEYNNENGNEEPKGERIRAHARCSPARRAMPMNHGEHFLQMQQMQQMQQVLHMQPTSMSTSTLSSTSASALSSASTGIARARVPRWNNESKTRGDSGIARARVPPVPLPSPATEGSGSGEGGAALCAVTDEVVPADAINDIAPDPGLSYDHRAMRASPLPVRAIVGPQGDEGIAPAVLIADSC